MNDSNYILEYTLRKFKQIEWTSLYNIDKDFTYSSLEYEELDTNALELR